MSLDLPKDSLVLVPSCLSPRIDYRLGLEREGRRGLLWIWWWAVHFQDRKNANAVGMALDTLLTSCSVEWFDIFAWTAILRGLAPSLDEKPELGFSVGRQIRWRYWRGQSIVDWDRSWLAKMHSSWNTSARWYSPSISPDKRGLWDALCPPTISIRSWSCPVQPSDNSCKDRVARRRREEWTMAWILFMDAWTEWTANSKNTKLSFSTQAFPLTPTLIDRWKEEAKKHL